MNFSQIHQAIGEFPLAFAGITIMALLVVAAVIYKNLRHRAKNRLKSDADHSRR